MKKAHTLHWVLSLPAVIALTNRLSISSAPTIIEVDQESVEAVIVEFADAIRRGPGARREDLEQYIKRLKVLEEIANSHQGVSESYAIQAGREVRIIVKPEDVDDLAAIQLSRDIAKQIEEVCSIRVRIKVTVIRETRAVDFAK